MENRPSYFEQDDLDEKVAALLTERADRGPFSPVPSASPPPSTLCAAMDWLNPVCHRGIYNPATWDLDLCFQATTLTLLPIAVLAVVGGVEFPALWRRYVHGERERLSRQGKAAYALKLVRVSVLLRAVSPFPGVGSVMRPPSTSPAAQKWRQGPTAPLPHFFQAPLQRN